MLKVQNSSRFIPGKTVAACWLALYTLTFIVAAYAAGIGAAFVSCFVLWTSAWLTRKTCQPFAARAVTITSFWYVTYLAMIFIPAFFVYVDQEGPYRARYLFAVHSVLITVPLGWILANRLMHRRASEDTILFSNSIERVPDPARLIKAYCTLLGLALAFTLLYLSEVKTIPLFALFRDYGDFAGLAILREESLKLLDSPFTYIYYLVREMLYPFLILISLGCFLQTRQKKWFWLFILTFVAGVCFAAFTLAKAPVAEILVSVGFFLYYCRRGSVGGRFVAGFLILSLLFPFFVVIGSTYGIGVQAEDIFLAIGSRLFYLPADVVYYYFEVFPHQLNYLHGRSIDKLSRLLGLQFLDTANYVGVYRDPTGLESVNANGAFIADLNADFGLWGVLFGGIAAGLIMQAVHLHVIRRRRTIVNLACYAFLVLAFWSLNSTSLPIVLGSDGVLLVLLVSWMLGRWIEIRLKPALIGLEAG